MNAGAGCAHRVETGEIREIFSGYFKVGPWDISPDDDALVFVTDSDEDPVIFVVPLKSRSNRLGRA